MALIPATILTGFLGSGKTTLLKRVLTEAHGQRIAVIENEFGAENIDNEILVADTEEQIVQMSNGCVCCTIREDLRSTLSLLAAKRRKGLLAFDRVIIETTGLADPGPVAQTFFMDDEIAESYLLDAIVTLVDAKHAPQQLDERQEARRQVGFADQIFISKADLVAPDAVEALIHRLKHMNPRAPIEPVHFGQVPLSKVLDLRGFNLNAKLEIDPDFLQPDGHAHDHEHDDHHHCDHEHGHCAHEHGMAMAWARQAPSPRRRCPELRLAQPAPVRSAQAGGLPGCGGAGLGAEAAALQRGVVHAGHRPQGDFSGRAPTDGQRPRTGVEAGRDAREQDGVHRHRPAARHPGAGVGTIAGVTRVGLLPHAGPAQPRLRLQSAPIRSGVPGRRGGRRGVATQRPHPFRPEEMRREEPFAVERGPVLRCRLGRPVRRGRW
jgi:G3E family GTPase